MELCGTTDAVGGNIMRQGTLVVGVSPEGDGDEEDAMPLRRFPMTSFPRLPQRSSAYWTEPITGVCVVGICSAMLVTVTHMTARSAYHCAFYCSAAVVAIWLEAIVAGLSTLYLLLSDAGVIKRSPSTCYPIPAEVENRLQSCQTLETLDNIPGPDDSAVLGSFCVRCLVWRPRGGTAHHCNICQRCYRNFDHHCGVFGRCIVQANMPCFMLTITMGFLGVVTVVVSVLVTS